MTEHHPITGEARRPRPPYDTRDVSLDQDVHGGETSETWRTRVHADRMDALTEHCPADLTDREHQFAHWLATWGDHETAVVSSLLARAHRDGHQAGQADGYTAAAELARTKAAERSQSTQPGTLLRQLAATLTRRANKLLDKETTR